MKNLVKLATYAKNGKTWELLTTTTDPQIVYSRLAQDLINKKLCACTYIKSITRRQNYNGTVTITVMFINSFKAEYIVESY